MIFIWPVSFFGKVLNYLHQNSKRLAVIGTFFAWFAGYLKAGVIGIMDSFMLLIDTINAPALTGASLGSIEVVGYVNSIIPVTEFVTLSLAYGGACVVVILIRWIKSFIPTIAN